MRVCGSEVRGEGCPPGKSETCSVSVAEIRFTTQKRRQQQGVGTAQRSRYEEESRGEGNSALEGVIHGQKGDERWGIETMAGKKWGWYGGGKWGVEGRCCKVVRKRRMRSDRQIWQASEVALTAISADFQKKPAIPI